jgi:hypothetical protein
MVALRRSGNRSSMRLLAVTLAALLTGAIVPSRAPAQEAPPSWLGVTFESPASQLRASLGDPVRLTRLPAAGSAGAAEQPPQREARYVLAYMSPVFLIIGERHGIVVGIAAESEQPLAAAVPAIAPDPNGIVLGATKEAVLRAHPDARRISGAGTLVVPLGNRYAAAYSITAGRVRAIDWFARPDTDAPGDGPPLSEAAGDSPSTAILDVAKTETEGIRWERIWQLFHPCDGTTQWTKSSVATSQQNGRRYDAVMLKCPTTGATRIVYFDITAFFGKF